MVHILIQGLLFGVSDTELEPLKKPEDIAEKPHDQVVVIVFWSLKCMQRWLGGWLEFEWF
jgi:hypothetical protein